LKGKIKGSTLKGQAYLSLHQIESDEMLFTEMEQTFQLNKIDIKKAIQSFHKIFIKNLESLQTLNQLCELLENLIEHILNHTPVRSYVLSGEVFNLFFQSIQEIKNSPFARETLEKNLIFHLFIDYIDSQAIHFETKPLQDLEIIGMLETRNLNFKNVIFLDVQEGILPQEKKIDPLFPIDLYQIMGLPDDNQSQEMHRYYFERLIKSAETVHLFYIQNEDQQRSRYIEKIIWEHEKKSNKLNSLTVKKTIFPIQLAHTISKEISVKKNHTLMDKLKKTRFSPTSLDSYLQCKLKFYFERILELDAPGEIAEMIAPDDRGTLIHSILKETFQLFVNKKISQNNYLNVRQHLEKIILKQFSAKPDTGEYYILKILTQYRLNKFLDMNIRQTPVFTPVYLESRWEAVLQTTYHQISFKGYIDRIDRTAGKYIIYDYKSGAGPKSDKIDPTIDLTDIKQIRECIHSFQLPVYLYMFLNNNKEISLNDVEAKLVLLLDCQFYSLFPEDNKKIGLSKKDLYDKFYMPALKTTIDDIMNPEEEFKKYDDTDCRYCAYTTICNEINNKKRITS